MPSDSRELIQRYCAEGDDYAFRQFYRSEAPRLQRYLMLRGCSEDEAYDLVADAFERFLAAACRDPRYPVALLYRIAANRLVDHQRRQGRAPVVLDPAAAAAGVSPPAQGGAAQDVAALLAELPADEQNLLLVRYWVGLTHREAAEALGVPEGTLRRRTAELLAELRERWGAALAEPMEDEAP